MWKSVQRARHEERGQHRRGQGGRAGGALPARARGQRRVHARDGGGGIVGPDARGGPGEAHAGVVPAQLLAGRGAAADRRFQQALAER